MGHDVYFLLIRIGKGGEWIGDRQEIMRLMNEYWGDHLFVFKKNGLFLRFKKIVILQRKIFNHGFLHCDDFYPNSLHRYVKSINRIYNFHCCIVNYYTYSKLLSNVDIPLKALTTHDLFSYKNLLTGEKYVWQCTTADQEAIAMQRSPHIFALNSEEAIFFSKLSPNSKIYNVYSVYDYKSSSIVGNRNILFLSGNNIYNRNGLNWFLNCIFPSIKETFPDVKLIIGGGICKLIEYLRNDPNIMVQGYIEDPDAFYAQGDIVINPTYQGTGLKIKTFEAISYDKVVLAHPHSAIGIFNPSEAPIFVSKDAAEWVEYLREIWSNTIQIYNIKNTNKQYIQKMQNYILNEYNSFFDCLER